MWFVDIDQYSCQDFSTSLGVAMIMGAGVSDFPGQVNQLWAMITTSQDLSNMLKLGQAPQSSI